MLRLCLVCWEKVELVESYIVAFEKREREDVLARGVGALVTAAAAVLGF